LPQLWLPPAVWFHGSQQQSTGGSSVRNGKCVLIITWFAQSIRWVLITPLGLPVEPDVNSTFATVSPVTRSRAASTAAVGVACRSLKVVEGMLAGADDDTTSSTPEGSASASARSNRAPSAANTSPGCIRSNTWRSVPNSVACSE